MHVTTEPQPTGFSSGHLPEPTSTVFPPSIPARAFDRRRKLCVFFTSRAGKRRMWNHSSKMSSSASPLPISGQWTPPETDVESSPRPDYFSDPFKSSPSFSMEDLENRWPLSPSTPELIRRMNAPRDASDDPPKSRPKPISSATAPYTPTKPIALGIGHNSGALQYPYTPDSSRILRPITQPVTPLAPSPWMSDTSSPKSPVQHALSSCMVQMENLIQTRQPNDDQMEFIVAQFENMANFLAAPESQTKTTDDHLFNEPEPNSAHDSAYSSMSGLGITTAGGKQSNHDVVNGDHKAIAEVTNLSDEYVAKVGKFIEDVNKSTEDLKMRHEEVKQLNAIQFDIIIDLRRELNQVYKQLDGMKRDIKGEASKSDSNPTNVDGHINDLKDLDDEKRDDKGHEHVKAESEHSDTELENSESPEAHSPPRRKRIIIVRKKQDTGFWASLTQAIDAFGDMLHEW